MKGMLDPELILGWLVSLTRLRIGSILKGVWFAHAYRFDRKRI
jgi:hypothetical protein